MTGKFHAYTVLSRQVDGSIRSKLNTLAIAMKG